jgi:acyl-CoA thioester hydrolase/thioesterase-3
MEANRSKFETILKVRPDDIDMNNHVHSSKYIDYVLAARYEQMEFNYKMPMQEFIKHGYGWVIKNTFIELVILKPELFQKLNTSPLLLLKFKPYKR